MAISKEALSVALRSQCAYLLMTGIWQDFTQQCMEAGNDKEVNLLSLTHSYVDALDKQLLTTIRLTGSLDQGVRGLPTPAACLFVEDERERCVGRWSWETLAEALLAKGEASELMLDPEYLSGEGPECDFFSVKAAISFDLE